MNKGWKPDTEENPDSCPMCDKLVGDDKKAPIELRATSGQTACSWCYRTLPFTTSVNIKIFKYQEPQSNSF